MKKLSFRNWFENFGNELLKGWLRAKEDSNPETFCDWIIGEYEYYLDYDDDYEVPYFGLFDHPSLTEVLISKN